MAAEDERRDEAPPPPKRTRIVCRRVADGDLVILFPMRPVVVVFVFVLAASWLGLTALITVSTVRAPDWSMLVVVPMWLLGGVLVVLGFLSALSKVAYRFSGGTVTRVRRRFSRERVGVFELDPGGRASPVEVSTSEYETWRLSIPVAGGPPIMSAAGLRKKEVEWLADRINRWLDDLSGSGGPPKRDP